MKTMFKTALVALVALVAFCATTMADNDRPVAVSQLPAQAQQIVKTYFGTKKVAMAKVESGVATKSYDVVFTDGTKLEFDRSGRWKEIDAAGKAVPARLIPATISTYVKQNYPGVTIVKIEKDRKEYEVKLKTGLEIKFNSKFQVIDID